MAFSKADDTKLKTIRDELLRTNPGKPVRAWQIRNVLQKEGIIIDESTIRGRFIIMKEPLSGGTCDPTPTVAQPEVNQEQKPQVIFKKVQDIITGNIPDEMKQFVPGSSMFEQYVERTMDRRLMLAYDAGKNPLTQGKQGTGKTLSHAYYAYKKSLPFFLFPCYPDMKLYKLFGDKTIINGSVKFQEGILVKAIQCPSVVLFDEVNYITNQNSVDFHALLVNRELFVKDAEDGNGKFYKLHPECRLGFAQNPRSSKYVGGNVKPSSFYGRMVCLDYPEFSKKDITKILKKRYKENMADEALGKFVDYYFACLEAVDKSEIPVDFSIRQIQNVIDLYLLGLELKYAIEDGLTGMLTAVSQPKAKESFWRLAQAVWEELATGSKGKDETVGPTT